MMLKDFAWNTFEFTGNIDSYIFYREINEKNRAEDERITAEAEAAISKNLA